MSLREAIKMVLLYFKTNITQEVLADFFEVNQSTVSRTIAALEGPLTTACIDSVPTWQDLPTTNTLIIDGSLHPCWSWADHRCLWSGKHKTTGHLHQYLVSLDGQLVMVTDPMAGSTHDAKALAVLRHNNPNLFPTDLLGDKGYIGTGVKTPFRKPPGGQLTQWQHQFNTEINKTRYVVERAIANFKTWRTMHTDYRRPLKTYTTAFNLIRALYFHNQTFT